MTPTRCSYLVPSRRRHVGAALVALLLIGAPTVAWAQSGGTGAEAAPAADQDTADSLIGGVFQAPSERRIKVVQHRLYLKEMRHQITPWFGINPSDALVFEIMGGLRYTFFPTEAFSVGATFGYAYGFDKALSDRLREDLTARPENIQDARLQLFFNFDAGFYPIYGKFSLMSEAIGSYDLGVYVGAGAMRFEELDGLHPCFDAGIGGNIYFNRWLSLRMDATYYLTIAESRLLNLNREQAGSQLRQNVFLSLGIGFLLPVD